MADEVRATNLESALGDLLASLDHPPDRVEIVFVTEGRFSGNVVWRGERESHWLDIAAEF